MSDATARLHELVDAIIADDRAAVSAILTATPELASTSARAGATRAAAREHFLAAIAHYLYEGDTPLHIVAAAYRAHLVPELVRRGAAIDARNRRGAQPLHYAADGGPGAPHWNPAAQRQTVLALIDARADPNAYDRNGSGPLHRAVRCRCAAAVDALLQGGADPRRPNSRGSTPMQLAQWTTGKGGSGSPGAKAQQEEIVRLLRRHDADR